MQNSYTKYDSTKYLVGRLLRENFKPHSGMWFLSVFLMVIIAASTATLAYLVQPAVDIMFEEKDRFLLFVVPMAVIAVSVIKGFSGYFQILITRNINMRIALNMRMRMYKHFMYADISMHNRKSSGHLVSHMSHDINMINAAIGSLTNGLIKQFLTVLFLVAVMFSKNVELSLIAFVGIPIAAIPIYAIGKKLRKFSAASQAGMDTFYAQMDETLKSSKLVKSYNAEEYEVGRVQFILNELKKLQKKIASLSLAASPFTEALGGLTIAGVIYYGGTQVYNGDITPGAFFAFFTAMAMAYKPLKAISGLNASFQLGLAGCKRVFTILDERTEIFNKKNAIHLTNVKGGIVFKDVCFNYVKDKTALDKLSVEIKSGTKVALVGHSGGGKSTIMNMILRFYDPKSGNIFIDGNNLKDVSLESLRDSMALVSQEVQLFDDTILENIRYCKTNVSIEEIKKAAKMAEADQFIDDLENGYNTVIGQNGVKLSGGQRQRLSIARAILHNPPILLLDEATSALDPISEKLVKTALDQLMQNRTTIVIAHRLSTVINADKICVIQDGKMIEEGNHKELLKKGKAYAELYQKQFEG